MKFYDLEVTEDEVKKAGENQINKRFKIMSFVSLGIALLSLFWLLIAISYITTKEGAAGQDVFGFVAFGVQLIVAAVLFIVNYFKKKTSDPMKIGSEIYTEKGKQAEQNRILAEKKAEEERKNEEKRQALIKYQNEQKKYNAILNQNKANYENDNSIIKYTFYTFDRITLDINGFGVYESNIVHKERYKTEYIDKPVYSKYEVYLRNGHYKIGDFEFDLIGKRNEDNVFIVYANQKPVFNSLDYFSECTSKKREEIEDEELQIKSKILVRTEIVDGPRNLIERFLGIDSLYEYTRYADYYADGHVEYRESKSHIKNL